MGTVVLCHIQTEKGNCYALPAICPKTPRPAQKLGIGAGGWAHPMYFV
jgi:hypothetical protein